eukprot:TRINITY_DN45563_c0_g1_i1.p1 TRINITY_DN45563_c0_g1~~TRINITY_DN45563_c0_g1_i1.p1  ORF type:complete len:539 (-),score=86.97 TRINITY_DN45563_c0_g1_i1:26-1483(-)
MGSVWAARVRGNVSSRFRGRWVAVKAIPIETRDGAGAAGALHLGLRECLSTFQDLSSAHVVRYESYWLEEPVRLPEEVQQFCSGGRSQRQVQPAMPGGCPSEALDRCDSGASCLQSLRFRDTRNNSFTGRWWSRSHDALVAPSGLDAEDSCGFVWEEDSNACFEQNSEPSSPKSTSKKSSADQPRLAWQDAAPRQEAPTGAARIVVLLIEMELMGPAPDGTGASPGERLALTLRSWLQRPGRSLSDAAEVFASLMLSVRHIHRKRIVHADLKPDNIFCVEERSKVTVVRIGDFGLAGENQLFRQFDQFSSGRLRTRNGLTGGTPGYAAPEILRSTRGVCACSDKVDIFACAVILLELLLQPLRTQMERIEILDHFHRRKAVPPYIQARLPKTRLLLQEMAESDPAARLSAEEVCKRFDKEVRKELCRSASQLCCDPGSAALWAPRCGQPDSSVDAGQALRAPKEQETGKREGCSRRPGRKGRRRA